MPIIPAFAPGQRQRGFTLIEILLVIGIIALLGAIALPQYQSYMVRSQAAELALKFDAVRTGIQVGAKSGENQSDCATLAIGVQPANLQSAYVQLSVNFEAVPGGFTPVFTACASAGIQGQRGVEVAREAHNLLSRNSTISQGAVIGESAVSFSVKLAGDTALCKVQPTGLSANTACGLIKAPSNQGTGLNTTPGPAITASAPQRPASAPVLNAQLGETDRTCTRGPSRTINRQVMQFGKSGLAHVSSMGAIPTGGDMRDFTAEVVISGGQAPNSNSGSATLLSYYATDANGEPVYQFSLVNPKSLTITLPDFQELRTGINVDDGKSHRVTMTWQSSDGSVALYDNGARVWNQAGINTGSVIRGNGKLVIGQMPPFGGSAEAIWGYKGAIANASIANKAITSEQASTGPLHTTLRPGSGLIADVGFGAGGVLVDSTNNAFYKAGGDFAMRTAALDTSVYVDKNCQ